ncbi:hypothetical protein ACJIZ3_020400 [Penstemon smallii]|uniref:Uncharacterized protein n=1 Tax=Penstemon smallii TaxID=265156 RepID=A0ABD3SJ06_9LAMI
MGRINQDDTITGGGVPAPNNQQPPPPAVGSYPQYIQPAPLGKPWHSGLFDCHLDATNAVMTAIFPCVTFGQIAEVLEALNPSQGSQLSCPFGSLIYLLMMGACSQCVIGSKYRKRLRNRYGLVEAPYQDVISHIFCPFCSLCQEFRELKHHGLDPALGWQGILARQQAMQQHGNEQINKPPPTQAMFM